MANKNDKWPDNISGRFYVDNQCIDCDLCRETAKEFFTRNDDLGYSYVYNQPKNKKEINLCIDALNGCPVDAIGEEK